VGWCSASCWRLFLPSYSSNTPTRRQRLNPSPPHPQISAQLRTRAAKIRLLALDSDGVLTDGGVYMSDDGHEFRRFDIKDGLGLKRVMEAGIAVAIISGADSNQVLRRAQKLGIAEAYVGVKDKLARLLEICQRMNLALDQVAYMGDDLPDLLVLDQVGLPCAPVDAVEAVKSRALWVASKPGGFGAVRELCDLLVEITPSPAG
jgi:3-deoxy-D-manno-octulosonate 8-phosphate phosphatase (KDO 8-P phosphatase)